MLTENSTANSLFRIRAVTTLKSAKLVTLPHPDGLHDSGQSDLLFGLTL